MFDFRSTYGISNIGLICGLRSMEVVTSGNYRQATRKRPRRSARPCDDCRRRKTRCVTDDGDINCVHCKLRGTSCSFRQKPPDRSAIAKTTSDGDQSPRSLPGANHNYLNSIEQAATIATAVSTSTPAMNGALPQGSSDGGGGHERHEGATGNLAQPRSIGNTSLGLAAGNFAELYGLASDMEPILMVSTAV